MHSYTPYRYNPKPDIVMAVNAGDGRNQATPALKVYTGKLTSQAMAKHAVTLLS